MNKRRVRVTQKPSLGLFARPSPACYPTEIDAAVRIPDIDIQAESRGRAPEPHLDAPDIFAGFQLQVADITTLDPANEIIVLLLLLSNSA